MSSGAPVARLALVAAWVAVAACQAPAGGSEEGADGAGGRGDGVVPAAGTRPSPTAPPRHVLDLDPDRPRTRGLDSARLAGAFEAADSLPRLRCLVIARHGEILAERCAGRFEPDEPANVKSVSKSVLSSLVGIAIGEGHLEGQDQRVVPLLAAELGLPVGVPAEDDGGRAAVDGAADGDGIVDARKWRITLGHLLSMQSGLERTSGRNYGGWVRSGNWVRDAIRRPMVAEPGGRMLYSTGNYHLLSAILTDVTGRSTLAYARSRLGDPLGIAIPSWPTDPQGIYFGGNDMRLSPRAMIRFGELYRNEGRVDGRTVVPEAWVRASLEPRTRSPWSGEEYGYGWFLGEAGRHPMFYAWGYGGQFIFIVPDLELTVATTSDPAAPRGGGHLRAVHRMLDEWIVPAAELGDR